MNGIIANSSKEAAPRESAKAEGAIGVLSPHYRGEKVVTGKELGRVNSHMVSLLQPNSMEAERYRRLRHQVENLREEGENLLIAVTSPVAGDGKSTTSINLAGALAQDRGASVLLVELDLRRPFTNIQEYLGIRQLSGPGVVDKVANPRTHWEDTTYYIPDFNLYVMPAGRRTEAPYEVLRSQGLATLLREARERYDFVIVDTPPVVILPDSQVIEKWVDGFLLVVGAGHTPRDMLEEALNMMSPEKVLGLVFNNYAPGSETKYYGKY